MMRVLILFMFGLFIIASPQVSNAGVLGLLFPGSDPGEPDPSDTLVAPFADPQRVEKSDEKAFYQRYTNVPLDQPHLPNADIADWVKNNTAKMLNFKARNAGKTLSEMEGLFATASVRDQYLIFLQTAGITREVNAGTYNVQAYAHDVPTLITEGKINGTYRWRFDVPVMVSYVLVNGGDTPSNNQVVKQAVIDIQIGRVTADDKRPDGLQIEYWGGKIEDYNPSAP